MKIIVTGHTSGIGKYLYNYFTQDHQVVGMSRTNGYDISVDREKIVAESKNCDLFINCAHSGDSQMHLLLGLCKQVPKIITFGSASTDYADILNKQYNLDKKRLEKCHRLLSMRTDVAQMLLIKLSFAETSYNKEKSARIDSDHFIKYGEIASLIQFWLTQPTITQITYSIKLTEYTINQVKSNIENQVEFDHFLQKVNALV